MKKRAASDYQKRAGGQKRFKLLAALMLLPALVHAQQGDTGQTACTDTTGAAIACAALTGHPGQDGRYGRDAQAGAPAFNYAALDASGSATTFGGHACVADQVTGLVWSTATLAMPWGAVPAAPRCGIATGWRLPTRRELLSIVHHGAASPAINAAAAPLRPGSLTVQVPRASGGSQNVSAGIDGTITAPGVVGTLGARFVVQMYATGQTSADLELPMWIVYLCVPLGSGLMSFRFLQVAVSFARTGALPKHDQAQVAGLDEEEARR